MIPILEANILFQTDNKEVLKEIKNIDMENICIISSFKIISFAEDINDNYVSKSLSKDNSFKVFVYKTTYEKCLRCWQYKKDVAVHEGICNRCKLVIRDVNNK